MCSSEAKLTVILKLVLVAFGQEESRVFSGDAGLDHLLVERARLSEEGRHVVAESCALDGARHGEGELAAGEGDIALALLLEADPNAVSDELVREGAGDA